MTGAAERVELPGLPYEAVDRWLRAELPELVRDRSWRADVLSGGLSNITYRLHLAGGPVILRRPPLGGVLPSAHDMKREYRVMSALGATAVPVPRTLALGADPAVLGYPFYVMTQVDGEVLRTAEDTAAVAPEVRAGLARQLVDVLADLHAVDLEAAGLTDYGRPDGYTERQIRRWGEQWERSRTRDLPDMERLLRWLADHVPSRAEGTVVHGDYRLDNTIVDLTGPAPRIAAVVDWELSTLGDPLADLGLALTYWHDRDDADRAAIPVAVGVTAHEGFPTGREFAEAYARRTGRDLGELPFYLALATMKLAVVLEGVHARYVGGHTVSAGYEGVGDAVPALVARGLRLIRS
jgi:aminoglycoside phosphotransferase (APT) family kinase protein